MEILQRLWRLADAEASRTKVDSALVFEPIGLILIRPLKRMEYSSTPHNSSTFAHTGGDGVHYGFVHLASGVSINSPIVMTVPANYGMENMIVGCSLYEFLCLGCQVGYLFLERLTYRDSKDETIYSISYAEKWFEQNYPSSDWESQVQHKKYLLGILESEFHLKPWVQCERRLNELQSQYLSLLELET